MSRESPKTEVKNMDLNDVEMVFGTPSSPKKDDKAVHTVSNEKRPRDQPGVHKPASESDGESTHPAQPLLEPERDRQKPPLAGPEVDDLDGDRRTDAAPYPGIDDGLLENGDKKPAGDEDTPNGTEGKDETQTHEDGVGTEDGKWLTPSHGHDETDFYYSYGDGYIVNGLHNRLGEADDRPISPGGVITVIPDVNTYQQKKNLAQGMMDLALLSANANQLRYVLESSINHPYYYPSLVFIAFSIILQVAVGVGLIMNSRYNVKDEKDICKADKINNMTILGIFLITIVNVFITSFSVATPTVLNGGAVVAAVQQNG